VYTTQDTTVRPIRLFQLPNTPAGDAAVTIIIQSLITWLVEYILVDRDLRSRTVSPIGFFPAPNHRLLRRFFLLNEHAVSANPGGEPRRWPVWLLEQAARAMLVAVPAFAVLWGPTVGIMTTVGTRSGGDWVFERIWVPQVYKLVFGGVLALLTTPAFAVFWLVRDGWMLLKGKGNGDR
jgi:hypothetical protein